MTRSIKIAAAVLVASTTLSTAASAAKPAQPPELSATELAAVQAHSYAVPASVAFGATLSALHSLGYVDINASKDAGTITATTEAKAKVIYNIIWGLGKKKLTQKASLLIEDSGADRSLVRLNLVTSETKARGIWGTSFTDGKLVKFADPYKVFFTALDAEIARRAPAPVAAVPAAATVVPAAPAKATTPTGN